MQGQQTLTRACMCTHMYACMHRNNTCMSHAQGLGFGARGAAVHTQIHTHACMQHVHGPHIHTKLSGCGIPKSRAAICTAGQQTGVSPRQVSVPDRCQSRARGDTCPIVTHQDTRLVSSNSTRLLAAGRFAYVCITLLHAALLHRLTPSVGRGACTSCSAWGLWLKV